MKLLTRVWWVCVFLGIASGCISALIHVFNRAHLPWQEKFILCVACFWLVTESFTWIFSDNNAD